ncbi:MAG: hypothetical protein AAGJ87_11825 [Pseudomonadota bacterium]
MKSLTAIVAGIAIFGIEAGGGFAAHAAEDDVLVSRLLACRDIAKNKKRLACLDDAIASLGVSGAPAAPGEAITQAPSPTAPSRVVNAPSDAPSTLDAAPAPGPAIASAPPSPTVDPGDDFGSEDLRQPRRDKEENKPQALTAAVVEIAKNKRGKLIVILDNGQVWRQLKADTNKLLVPKDPAGETVIVRKRSLGSYQLGFERDRRRIKVERIK